MRSASNDCYFFGTFNPIHSGHLAFAEAARRQHGFDRVIFVPGNVPPHKLQEQNIASYDARCDMVELACKSNPRFVVSRIEATLPTPSYSIDTLRQLVPNFDKRRKKIPFILGADALEKLNVWKEAETCAKKLLFLSSPRDGIPIPQEMVLNGKRFPLSTRSVWLSLPQPIANVSSTMVRNLIQSGLPINHLVPQAVADYIKKYQPYQKPAVTQPRFSAVA
jgi:nicotinate-nucleotide adenylyltransferase